MSVNKQLLDALEKIAGMTMSKYISAGEAMTHAKQIANEAIAAAEQAQHRCKNCEGVQPETCVFNAEQSQHADTVAWEYREFYNDDPVTAGWSKWRRIESERWPHREVSSVVADIREFIAQGYRYELRALYAKPQAVTVPDEWLEFVSAVARQVPEKPDHWSSCGQCASNIDRAEDLLAAAQKGDK